MVIFFIIFLVLFFINHYCNTPIKKASIKDINTIYISEKNQKENFISNDPKYENLKNIDNSYFINLDRSVKRLKHIEEQCKKYNINVKRVKAVDGTNIDKQIVKSVSDNKESKWNMIKGELGCYLSHCKIWELFKNSNDKIITVLEDDINFSNTFLYQLDLAMKDLPNDWDILLIGFRSNDSKNICDENRKTKCSEIYSKHLRKVNYNWFGTHGYLLNRRSIDKFLEKCKISNITKPIDLAMSDFYFGGMNVYSTNNEIVSSYSHTPNTIDNSQIINAVNR